MPRKDPEEARAYWRAYGHSHREQRREQLAEWLRNHKELKALYDKRYLKLHADEVRLAHQKWRAANHEQWVTVNREWNQRNPEKRQAIARKYAQLHPEKCRALSASRRARLRNTIVEVIDFATIYQRDKGICGICYQKVKRKDFNLDHILPLAKGGTHEYCNVQVAHKSCNSRKRDRAIIPQQLRMIG